VLLSLLALAVVDSINPSAIVVTLYLLTRDRAAPQAAVYIAAIFVTYFALGAAMMSGVAALLPSLTTFGDARIGLIAEGIIGLGMLTYAFKAPSTAGAAPAAAPRQSTYAGLALLGLTVTIMELPTAVPYFAAIALLTSAGLSAGGWLPLLLLYNAIFVLPPVLLTAAHVVSGRGMEARFATLRTRLQAGARETMVWIFGLVGGALLVTSVIEYAARFMR
jgi:cytochrome c biogenesis protein CcdA